MSTELAAALAAPAAPAAAPEAVASDCETDLKLCCSITRPDLEADAVAKLLKTLVGKTGAYENIGWLFKLARFTDFVQDNMQNEIMQTEAWWAGRTGPREINLTPDSFVLWLEAMQAPSEEDPGAELLGDRMYDLMYTALAASVLAIKGFAWLEDDMQEVDERIDVLVEKDTDAAAKQMEVLEVIKGTMDLVHEEMEKLSSTHIDMVDAILTADLGGILDAVEDGTFQLDIGKDPEL
jgi:hypothetical protein